MSSDSNESFSADAKGWPDEGIFLSAAESPPDLTEQWYPLEVIESLNLRFLKFDPSTQNWLTLPGKAGVSFWVAPNGLDIIFLRDGALWLRDAGTEERRLLALPDPSPLVHHAAWSPDGRRFATSFALLGTSLRKDAETWVIDLDGSGKTRLPLLGTDRVHDWSPDGEWLITSSVRHVGDKRQIYLVRPDGTGRRHLVTDGACTDGRFSPDGRQIATLRGPRVTTDTPPDPRERGAIWIMDLDGSNDHMIFGRSERCCQNIHWSPDGERLATIWFMRQPAGTPRADKLDLSKPFVSLIDASGVDVDCLQLPHPFKLVNYSMLDWR